MRIAILTTDNREQFRTYEEKVPWFGAAPKALLQGFAELSDIEVHVVSCVRRPMSSPEKIADNIWFHPVVVSKWGWLSTGYQGCIHAVRKKLREIQPDLVHGQGTERDCAMTAVFSGFPNVLTIHGHMRAMQSHLVARFPDYHWWAAKLETLTLKKTAGVFCNSTYTESLVLSRAKRTWLVANPVRLEFFLRGPSRHHTSRPRIISVGIISDYKRQVEILQMCGRLHRRGLLFEINFVGAISRASYYGSKFLDELAVAKREGYANYLGTKGTSELIQAYDASDALLHCPTEEAFGLVVAEALSRNLKLFASAVGGVVDIADGVESAELYERDDWNALEEGIARWLRQSCPRPTLAAAEMRRRYHPECIARRHVEIYGVVLGKRTG